MSGWFFSALETVEGFTSRRRAMSFMVILPIVLFSFASEMKIWTIYWRADSWLSPNVSVVRWFLGILSVSAISFNAKWIFSCGVIMGKFVFCG